MPLIPANIFESAFGPLITVFEEVLVFMHNELVGGSWGWAIIGLTVAIRLVLFPLFVRQMKSIVTLQRHMPEMKAIQEKFKEDKQRQNEELMKFYRENHINPFASCLPLLLQMPVLISLYYMLRTDLKKKICGPQLTARYNHLHHAAITGVAHLPTKYVEKTSCAHVAGHSAKFLFIPDLTTKASGVVLGVLVVLYVLTMMASSLLSSATADRNQRLMAIGLPLMFTLFVINFPTGLLVYWISSNIWTIGQGAAIRRSMPPVIPPSAAAGKGAPKAQAAQSRLKLGPFSGGESEAANGDDGPVSNGTAEGALAPPPPPRKRKRRRPGRRR
ncbi:MAG: YidC/Oxa1 family membrane protein insertase [Solirubrobacteraceae bacterium]